jgi:hypothetical protein
MYFVYNLTICGPWGKVGTKFILLARKVPTLVATFPHKTSITTGSVHSSRECILSYLSTGISNLFQLGQAEVVLGQHSSICITS